MFPGINPKMMKQAMKKMGMKQEEIPATEVIIKTPDKTLVIDHPQVTKINAMGQESIQVIGDIREESGISKEDVNMIVEKTGVSADKAKKVLEKNKGDLAKSILELES